MAEGQIQNDVVEFVTLLNHDDYEILNQYPFTIRRKRDHYVISESILNTGYIQVALNRKPYLKHILIAKQFLDNPNNLPFVYHINHNRVDNHLENLRWVTHSQNNFNKSSRFGVQYEFIDNIPEDSIKVLFYDTRTEHREFEDNKYYYYHDEQSPARSDDENDEDIFYGKITDNIYRILHINIRKCGTKCVSLQDINNKQVNVCINRFKYQHSLD